MRGLEFPRYARCADARSMHDQFGERTDGLFGHAFALAKALQWCREARVG
jgi:hypothetical protein